ATPSRISSGPPHDAHRTRHRAAPAASHVQGGGRPLLVSDVPRKHGSPPGRDDLHPLQQGCRDVRAPAGARRAMIPRLIHPIDVLVEQVDSTATAIDADFREPVNATGAVFRPAVQLRAQITWGTKDEFRRSPGGDEYQADGHLTFLRAD